LVQGNVSVHWRMELVFGADIGNLELGAATAKANAAGDVTDAS